MDHKPDRLKVKYSAGEYARAFSYAVRHYWECNKVFEKVIERIGEYMNQRVAAGWCPMEGDWDRACAYCQVTHQWPAECVSNLRFRMREPSVEELDDRPTLTQYLDETENLRWNDPDLATLEGHDLSDLQEVDMR